MAQTAIERLNKAKSPKVVILEKDFAGIRAGSSMFVATPKIVDEFINNCLLYTSPSPRDDR